MTINIVILALYYSQLYRNTVKMTVFTVLRISSNLANCMVLSVCQFKKSTLWKIIKNYKKKGGCLKKISTTFWKSRRPFGFMPNAKKWQKCHFFPKNVGFPNRVLYQRLSRSHLALKSRFSGTKNRLQP